MVLGRAGLDLYADPAGTPIEEAQRFVPALGGSAANIAVALARQGLRAALLIRLADDAVGGFCRRELNRFGVDATHVGGQVGAARTSLAVVETRGDVTRAILYRNGAADLGLTRADVEAVGWADLGGLVATGTALAAEPSRRAAFRALDLARAAGLPLILDIDHRPSTWADPGEAGPIYARAAALCDVVVGNDVEWGVLAGDGDGLDAARAVVARGAALVVFKMGGEGAITLSPESEVRTGIFETLALKPTGAGDAFLGGLVAGLAAGMGAEAATLRGAATAALVVARVGCAPAMPDAGEVDAFMAGRPAPAVTRKGPDAHPAP